MAGPRCLPALAQHPAEALRARDAVGSGPVHGDVAVTFEQAHEPGDLDGLVLLGAGQQHEQAPVVEGVLALAHLIGRPLQGSPWSRRGSGSTPARVDSTRERK